MKFFYSILFPPQIFLTNREYRPSSFIREVPTFLYDRHFLVTNVNLQTFQHLKKFFFSKYSSFFDESIKTAEEETLLVHKMKGAWYDTMRIFFKER
ncbi:hypothetical protein D3I35_03045 [Enterococcus faecium]|nr:hypothetical protein [Enterococcus faecium]